MGQRRETACDDEVDDICLNNVCKVMRDTSEGSEGGMVSTFFASSSQHVDKPALIASWLGLCGVLIKQCERNIVHPTTPKHR